jgi:hypothetical protein
MKQTLIYLVVFIVGVVLGVTVWAATRDSGGTSAAAPIYAHCV